MIFVTTGTQVPFDRLIKTVDELAKMLPDVTFKVQAYSSEYKAVNFDVLNFISPEDFENYILDCDLIISHAGMGTVISALVNKKPIIVMPRLVKFKEQRNEHQLASAKKLEELGYVYVAYHEQELLSMVLNLWPNNLRPLHNVGNNASQTLINSIHGMIFDNM